MAKILVIEDDESISSLLKQVLELENHEVESAENGRDALTKLETAKDLPEVIILDMMMPVMNGAQFRQEQLQNEAIRDIPILLMTADSAIQKIEYDLKPNGILRKPITIDAVLKKVNELILDKSPIS
jgi:two-component system, chemotaxis family, chemotaxis protein CheY